MIGDEPIGLAALVHVLGQVDFRAVDEAAHQAAAAVELGGDFELSWGRRRGSGCESRGSTPELGKPGMQSHSRRGPNSSPASSRRLD